MSKTTETAGAAVVGVLGVIVLAVAGVFLGAAAIEKLARPPRHPCPNCGKPVKQDAPRCESCGVELTWRKSA